MPLRKLLPKTRSYVLDRLYANNGRHWNLSANLTAKTLTKKPTTRFLFLEIIPIRSSRNSLRLIRFESCFANLYLLLLFFPFYFSFFSFFLVITYQGNSAGSSAVKRALPLSASSCFIATFRSSLPGNEQVSGDRRGRQQKIRDVSARCPANCRFAQAETHWGFRRGLHAAFLFVINEML